MRAPLPTDRRARRTREAILDGFAALVTERRYDAVRIADIVAAAGIGKATFYEHFNSKDALLLSAMEPILLGLSTAASGRAARSYIKGIMAHLWDRRALGRTILNSATAPIVQRRLAEMIRPHVERRVSDDPAPAIRATGIAAAQLAMLRSWLVGEASSSADDMADRMIDCAKLAAPTPR